MRTRFSRRAFGPVTLVLPVAAMVMPTAQLTAQPEEQLLAEVRAAWEAREKATKTVKVAWVMKDIFPKGSINLLFPELARDGHARPPEDFKYEGTVTLLLDGIDARFTADWMCWDEKTSRFQQRTDESTYRGGKFTNLVRRNVQSFPQGTLNKASWNRDCDITTWPARAAFRGTNPKVMSGTDLDKFTTARRVVLDRQPMVELVRQRTEMRGEERIWVNPAKSCATQRYDSYDRAGTLNNRITVKSIQDPSGLWVPASWTAVVYNQKKLVRSVEATVRELVINPPTTPEDFEVAFPVGTYVVDSTSDKPREYIVRESGERRDVLPNERLASYEDLLGTETGELEPGGRPSLLSQNRMWFIALGLLLIVSAVVVSLIRRARCPSIQAGEAPGPVPPTKEDPR